MTADSTLVGFPHMVIKALEQEGFNRDLVLESSGIEIDETLNPDTRVPIQELEALFDVALELTKDTAFGLKVGACVVPTTFSALSLSMWLSSNLKEAMDKAARYGELLSKAAISGVEEEEDSYCYWSRLVDLGESELSDSTFAALDSLYAAMLTLCRSLSSDDFKPVSISLLRPEPKNPRPYFDFFACEVLFGQPRFSLTFSKKSLEKPIVSAHPELLQYTEYVLIESLNRVNQQDVVGRLRAKLIEWLPKGKPDQEEIAHALSLSLRSLQRKLQEQGVTYKQVLEEVRQELALKHIVQPELSIGDISYLLGFSSDKNFARSFKSWTGQSPSEYRSSHASFGKTSKPSK